MCKQRSKSSSDDLEIDSAPPLPQKEKRPSLVNSQDFFTSTPKAGVSGYSTPSNQSPHNSLIINVNNDSFNSIMDCSSSPLSVSPASRSPSSSMGSGLNHSAEDLGGSNNPQLRKARTNSFSRVQSESGIGIMKKITMTKSASQSDGTIDQINELTLKINEMTQGIAKIAGDNPPPLPQKRTPARQTSMYDNVTDSGVSTISSSSRTEHRMSSSSTSSSQSFSGFSISQKTTSVSYSHRTSSQETCSSLSSASHSSVDSLPKPPPLPPKKKHSKFYTKCIILLIFRCD